MSAVVIAILAGGVSTTDGKLMAMIMATIVIMNPNTNHTMKVRGVDPAALAVLAVANLARAVESLASQVDHGADPERVASQATPAVKEASLAERTPQEGPNH